jgi:hypothetical protein
MRLTLRTMLAYLDDVLEPEDAEELGQKIGESEFASELVYRALTSTRKLDLSAPAVVGTGMGRDANTVAEYLDNALSADQLPEFEHVCLESDEQLAEVTSCHRILTMVLTEPVEVPSQLRDRVNTLNQVVVEESTTSEARRRDLHNLTLAERRELDRQPAYLAAGRSRLRERIIPATILVVLFGLVGLRMVGHFDSTHPLLGSFFPMLVDDRSFIDTDDSQPAPLALGSSHSSQPTDPNAQQPLAQNRNISITNHSATDLLLVRSVADKTWQRMAQGKLLEKGMQLSSLPAFQPQLSLSNRMRLTLFGHCQLQLNPAISVAGSALQIDRGRLILSNAGARDSELQITVAGTTGTVELPSPGASLLLEVERYLPPGSDPAEVESLSVVRIICIGAARWLQKGAKGAVQRISDEPGYQVYTLIGEQDVITGKTSLLPAWARQQPGQRPLEHQAVTELIEGSDQELSISDSLRAQFDTHRKPVVRALAARCLAALGEYDAIVQCWSNPDLHAFWEDQLLQLRAELAWGTETAQQIEQVLEQQRKADAEMLYRMLWGYSPSELESEAGAELVERLSHEQMDVRLLAYTNLHWMTGRTQQYQVHRSPDRELPHIQGWRRLLKDGLVRYDKAPHPLMVLAPIESP